MSQEELVFLIAVTVIMPIVALWIILNYQKARLQAKQARNNDDSLTTTELEELIDESVAKATAGLQDRVEALEGTLNEIEAPKSAIQDDLDAFDDSEPARAKTLGKSRST